MVARKGWELILALLFSPLENSVAPRGWGLHYPYDPV